MKLLTLIKTSGIEYDDRLRKEMLSLQKLGLKIHIVALEYKNISAYQTVYGGIPATTIALWSRSWFTRAHGLPVKAGEMYWRFLIQVIRQKPDIVWLHNLDLQGLVPLLKLMCQLGCIKRIIWDQHELPTDAILNSSRRMVWLGRLMNWCDVIVMANGERKELMEKILADQLKTPIEILQNYPDQFFRQLPVEPLPQSIQEWLQDSPYLLAQGGANPDRNLPELIEAIMQQPRVKLIVVGPYRQLQLDSLSQKYSDMWKQQIFFTGFVPQLEIAPYIDHSLASVVFYTITTNNSYLCAPNRLYQALSRSIPTIVGSNPPMRQLIEQSGCGVIVNPNKPESILHGIQTIQTNVANYRKKAYICSENVLWENQAVWHAILSDQNTKEAKSVR